MQSITESELLAQAIALAAEKHKNQRRKDGTPYIYHPFKVADMVKNAGYGIPCQIVGILHDVLEDTDTTEEELHSLFGQEIVTAVKLLTRPEGADEAEYVAAILTNPMASAVKAADKVNNLWETLLCPDKQWARYYVAKSDKYYRKKFSCAVDDALCRVSDMIRWDDDWEYEIPFYTQEDMRLYNQ